MEIRKADETEFEAVSAFYHSLIDAMQDAEYKPMWEKDVYPTSDALRDAIHNGELYIGLAEREIAAAMVLNHRYNEEYKQCRWPTEAGEAEITVIHLLGVHPRFTGRGLAKQMVSEAIGIAAADGQRVIRLDVLAGNLPAERLYPSVGFRYVDTVPMYYEDTGWTDFKLYEYAL